MRPLRWLDLAARKLVVLRLDNLERGSLTLEDASGTVQFGESGSPSAHLRVRDSAFYRRVVIGGAVALGETHRDGLWEAEDLTTLLYVLALNREVLTSGAGNSTDWSQPIRRLDHWMRRNTREQSRRNVQSHYDLGNDFYGLFLDESMTYSCAYFESPSESLEQAQVNKLDRVLRLADIQSGHEVLEIGSGWGSFALRAARKVGCPVTTTTVSDNQYRRVSQAVREAGLEDRVTVLKQDYRDLSGRFDRVVSVEMIEAVGEAYLGTFFEAIDRLLRPDGRVFLQAIHMRDALYESYRSNVDFIQQYIFPGGHLPSVSALVEAMRETSLVVTRLEEIGQHYDRTLGHWQRRFRANRQTIEERRGGARFARLWDYYFSYCRAGFRAGMIGDVQMVLEKPPILRDENG